MTSENSVFFGGERGLAEFERICSLTVAAVSPKGALASTWMLSPSPSSTHKSLWLHFALEPAFRGFRLAHATYLSVLGPVTPVNSGISVQILIVIFTFPLTFFSRGMFSFLFFSQPTAYHSFIK